MFHAPMGRFQLELIYYFTYFYTVVPSKSCVFLSCRPFVVNTFSIGLVGVEVSSVSWLGQMTNDERPTGKKHNCFMGRRWKIGEINKLILIDLTTLKILGERYKL